MKKVLDSFWMLIKLLAYSLGLYVLVTFTMEFVSLLDTGSILLNNLFYYSCLFFLVVFGFYYILIELGLMKVSGKRRKDGTLHNKLIKSGISIIHLLLILIGIWFLFNFFMFFRAIG